MALLLGLHVALARALGAEEYGIYSFAMSVAGVLVGLTALGLPTALTRYICEYEEKHQDGLLRGALLSLPLTALLVGGLFAVALYLSVAPLLDQPERAGVQYAAILLPVLVFEKIRRQYARARGHAIRSILPDELIRPAAMLIALLFASIVDASQALVLFGAVTLATSLGFFVPGWTAQLLTLRDTIAEFEQREWMITALPMALAGMSYILLSRTDVIMMGALADMKSTGVYAAANRLAMLNQVVLSTITVVVTPLVTRAWHGGRPLEVQGHLSHARRWLIGFSGLLSVMLFVFAPTLLALFGDEYAAGASVLRILVIGQFANAVAGPVGTILSMSGKQKENASIMLMAALCNIALNSALIPRYGGEGAAAASMICMLLLNLLLMWRVHTLITTAKTDGVTS